ncbi:hypothetical protein [Selenomonas ruminantium]|uniref:hypothetical protein n=1 Tax=Selenomonas ruminantium TaxID=971 RepID=UPI00047B1688|nr:hypothetical protein [Selenomonas ruminantium]
MRKNIIGLVAIFFVLCGLFFFGKAEAKEIVICTQGKGNAWSIEDLSIRKGVNGVTTFSMYVSSGGDSEQVDIAMWYESSQRVYVWQRVIDPDHLYFKTTYEDWSGYFRDWLRNNDYLD